MSCGGTQAQFAVRRRGKVRFVRFDQKRQSLTRFVAAPFSHKTPRTTLRFAGALRYPQASADLSAKPTKEQAPNALDNQHLAQGDCQRGCPPLMAFGFFSP